MSPAERERFAQARGAFHAVAAALRPLAEGPPEDRIARRARHLAELAAATAEGLEKALGASEGEQPREPEAG